LCSSSSKFIRSGSGGGSGSGSGAEVNTRIRLKRPKPTAAAARRSQTILVNFSRAFFRQHVRPFSGRCHPHPAAANA
jgi:hypothetical protein